jgi:hypothetical protein
MRIRHLALLLALGLLPASASSGDKDKGDGFVPMFNGKDLTGWVNVNCAPETFFVKDDMVITTGKPTGYLRTARQYENFIAEFDWMHIPPGPGEVGNSGFFVWCDPIPAIGTPYSRGIEVQVLVNLTYKDKKTGAITATSQGDLFSIWGATCVPDRPHPLGWARCLPSEDNCKGANEWNHYRVEANDGVIKLTVNGKTVSGVSKCNPRKGYLALESEGSECRFKNLKIKELPSTNPKPEETADIAKSFQNMYTGLDLRGWKANDEQKKHWKPRDWVLVCDGKNQGEDALLAVEKDFDNFEMIVDWRLPNKQKQDDGKPAKGKFCGIWCSGLVTIASGTSGPGEFHDGPNGISRLVPKEKAEPKPGQWNRFRIRMKGASISVALNNKVLLNNVEPSWPIRRTPIGLVSQGYEVEFGNVFIRELGKGE